MLSVFSMIRIQKHSTMTPINYNSVYHHYHPCQSPKQFLFPQPSPSLPSTLSLPSTITIPTITTITTIYYHCPYHHYHHHHLLTLSLPSLPLPPSTPTNTTNTTITNRTRTRLISSHASQYRMPTSP